MKKEILVVLRGVECRSTGYSFASPLFIQRKGAPLELSRRPVSRVRYCRTLSGMSGGLRPG